MKIQNTQSKFAIRALGIVGASLLAFACSGSDDEGEEPVVDAVPPVLQPPPEQPAPEQPAQPEVTPPPAPPAPPPPSNDVPTLTPREQAQAAAQNILQANCGGCHGQDAINNQNISGGLDYIEDLDALQANNKLVVGDSAGSPIVARMQNGTMPPPGVQPRPSDQEISTIAQFIDNPVNWPGVVLNEECTDTNQTLDFDTLWETIQRDFLRQDIDDQPFIRYITLQNKFNAGICADAPMDLYRNGMQKAINSLSDESRVTRAEPIDSDRLTYRIDTRDYGWDEAVVVDDGVVAGGAFADKWEAIVGLSPFAVQFQGDQADQVRQAAGTDIPMIYADALVDVGTIGNLYYALVNVPDTLDQLLLDLQVDREQDQDQRREFRAGTTKSIVSRQDRTVTRNVINVGGNRGFWQSFDFLANADADSIFADAIDFEFDNSEAIFTLNNGLLGYAIFDGVGNRLEESDILLDTNQNDFKARTAVSCSGCHAQGLLEVQDEVRQFAFDNRFNFNADEFEDIQELYDDGEFASSLENDNRIYSASLNATGVPLNVSDPIQDVFISFDDDLDLAAVAGDVGVSPELLRNELPRLDDALQVVRSSTIDRDDFTNIFQATICVMQTFSTNRPDDNLCAGFIAELDLL